jgi:sugar lactone lactonase YvrE
MVELAFPLLSPNGCGLSPESTMLYVADTAGARLWAFDVEAPGVLRAPEPFRPTWPCDRRARAAHADGLTVMAVATSSLRRSPPAL